MASLEPVRTANSWEFDAAGLAELMTTRRRELGWSTRELARRAGISQPYVVALERARQGGERGRGERAPTPTVDVLVRLADALGVRPDRALSAAVRRAGSHVLLVAEDGATVALPRIRRTAGPDDTRWIWAASGQGPHAPRSDAHAISLRSDLRAPYRPDLVASALDDEIRRLAPQLEHAAVGFVFAETSAVMEQLDDPATVLDFEHGWSDVVSSAARRHGVHAAWNICVYDLPALRRLPDPVAAAVDLMRSHDDVWTSTRTTVLTGTDAARRVLHGLCPEGTSAQAWADDVRALVDRLQLAA